VLKDDVLLKVNGEAIEQLRDIFRISRESTDEVLTFTVQRGDKQVEAKMRKEDLRR